MLNSLTATVASKGLGSEMSYVRLGFVTKKYLEVIDKESPIFPGSVLSFGLRADYIRATEGRSTPFSERFIPGGIFSIRGHPFRSLGPFINVPFNMTNRRADDNELDVTDTKKLRLGGNKQIIYNMEFLFDIFREANIKGVLFFDAGNTFKEGSIDWSEFRASAGFGFRWFSPMGPLRFEWGIPLDRRAGEDAVLFDFSIGSPF
jgi:outer membrane protein insertion porin family